MIDPQGGVRFVSWCRALVGPDDPDSANSMLRAAFGLQHRAVSFIRSHCRVRVVERRRVVLRNADGRWRVETVDAPVANRDIKRVC